MEWDSHPGSWHGGLCLHCCSTRKRVECSKLRLGEGGEDRRVSFTFDCGTTLRYRPLPCPTPEDANATRQSMRGTRQRQHLYLLSDTVPSVRTLVGGQTELGPSSALPLISWSPQVSNLCEIILLSNWE